ncbi:hypothetical protein F4778DRAFT_681545 [Xylariomycetidae sp. FL2044]|nr:hypothetical protein F4778DRAFT_681545 [Xylariomycetidae sp. FL2044]
MDVPTNTSYLTFTLMPPNKKVATSHVEGRQTLTSDRRTSKNSLQINQTPTVEPRRSERIRKLKSAKAPEPAASKQTAPKNRTNRRDKEGTVQSKPAQTNRKAEAHSRLTSWLEQVRRRDTESAEAFDNDCMAPPSVLSLNSLTTATSENTVKPLGNARKKVNREALRTRRVEIGKPYADDWTTRFRKYLVEEPMEIPFNSTTKLQSSLRDFLAKAKKARGCENSYDAIETLCDEINNWKATARLATITNQDFNRDLEHCKDPSNEAVFQRTVMMSIIDRSHLKETFDFNCEGQWSLQGTYPLPSTNGPGDMVTGPKPDLAIFFRYDELVGTDPVSRSASIPKELQSCINPDGYLERCFPFIFVEAKRGFDNIEPAVLANMHSASQALFNIYAWMNRAKQDTKFFTDVRLFSMAINAEKLIVRVHRAREIVNGDRTGLVFTYDDLYHQPKFYYTRDEACTFVHNILNNYAKQTLLPTLKDAIATVLKEHERDVGFLKRKSDAAIQDRPGKRFFSQAQVQHQVVDPSSSMGMSGVHIDDT